MHSGSRTKRRRGLPLTYPGHNWSGTATIRKGRPLAHPPLHLYTGSGQVMGTARAISCAASDLSATAARRAPGARCCDRDSGPPRTEPRRDRYPLRPWRLCALSFIYERVMPLGNAQRDIQSSLPPSASAGESPCSGAPRGIMDVRGAIASDITRFHHPIRQHALCGDDPIHHGRGLCFAEPSFSAERDHLDDDLVSRYDPATEPHSLDAHEMDNVAG